jgi:putative polyketide hydroxylase
MDDAELTFGFRYDSTAIVADPPKEYAQQDGVNIPPLTQHPSTLNGEPGTRAPHLVLKREGEPLSTIDLCMGRWTLLIGSQGSEWNEAASRVAQRLDLPLSAYLIEGKRGLKDVEGRFSEVYGVGPMGAVLVRPDGFVAWRSSELTDNPRLALESAVARIFCKELPKH